MFSDGCIACHTQIISTELLDKHSYTKEKALFEVNLCFKSTFKKWLQNAHVSVDCFDRELCSFDQEWCILLFCQRAISFNLDVKSILNHSDIGECLCWC